MPKPNRPPAGRVTLGQIAQAAQVHHTTVSRALRNHPAIPAATRTRIKKIADKLGYRPDPMLSALAAYRKSRAPVSYQSNLAWLTNFPTADGWCYREIMAEYLAGAKARAEQLGYGIDLIWFRSLGKQGGGAAQTLLARGIRGILLPPQPVTHTHLRLPWKEFSGVSFGLSLTRPPLHSVSNYQYGSIVKLTRHLLALGYRRPALVCSASSDERLNFAWSAGFRAELAHRGHFHRDLLHLPATLEKTAFLRWYERARPDVLIADSKIRRPNDLADLEQNVVYHWLADEGVRVPADVSIAGLALPSSEKFFGGITENATEMGAAAVDLLTANLQRGEFGPPRLPIRISVEGSYRSGPSIRPPRRGRV